MFANDAPGIQGVPPIYSGPVKAGVPLAHLNVPHAELAQSFRFSPQIPVASIAYPANNAAVPASTPNEDPRAIPARAGSGLVRRIFRTVMEKRDLNPMPLTGSPFDGERDPGGTGRDIEPASRAGITHMGDADGATMGDLIPIGDAAPDGAHDNASDAVRSFDSVAQHDALRAFRAAFPFVSIIPVPRCRSLMLVAGVPGEMQIPDGTVVARITWNVYNSSSLFVGVDSAAFIPSAARQARDVVSGNDGVLLNPSQESFYYLKDKKSLSFLCGAACIVNVQCYS